MTVMEAPAPETLAAEPGGITLIASVMVGGNEHERYLEACVEHLLEFCDVVAVRYENATGLDELPQVLRLASNVEVLYEAPTFYRHEGRARQELLDFTLALGPTHILAIDADEFIADGALLRRALQDDLDANGLPKQPTAWSLCMQEVWNITPDGLELREDGGWAEKDVPHVWTPGSVWRASADEMLTGVSAFTMKDSALACGRIPIQVTGRAGHTCTAEMHFGWTARHERQPRYDRYQEHDGGAYHAKRHLDSILLADDEIELWPIEWPPALESYRERIVAHAGVVVPTPKPVDPVPLKEIIIDKETRVQLEVDLAMFGACYIMVDPEGKGVRLRPDEIDDDATFRMALESEPLS